ncbi:hypothetical protein L3Q82_013455 [Scortum barcoo]|uniref:Uncharacterized protein n=1 Tax=Scortum barcoo TaxID=214431 RepID=A0ACB8VZW0_9TELE|nr:hypothetical protein L3Q82_013455 [Scortum barcoo]
MGRRRLTGCGAPGAGERRADLTPDHVHRSKIMTLLNESDETSPPSFPLSSLEHNFSIFVTHDPPFSPTSFPSSSSPSLTSSNCTSSPSAPSPPYNFYAVLLLVLLIFCVVFGNVLVCVAVSRERALQTTTNYLIVSLAVSDLLLATLVMPWGVYLEKACQPRQPHNIQRLEVLRADLIHPGALPLQELANYLSDFGLGDGRVHLRDPSLRFLIGRQVGGIEEILEVFLPPSDKSPVEGLQEGRVLCTAVRPVGTNNSKRPIPNPKAQGSDPLVHRGELQHMAAELELGSYKQAHTSSPPLTLGNSRVVEGPAPLKELGFQSPSYAWRVLVQGIGSSRPPATTATQTTLHRPLMDLPAGGEPTGRRAHVRHFGLSPAGSRGQRPGHQALACEPQPQAWLQGGAPFVFVVLKVVGEWRFSLIHCDILLTLDVMMCTASILNLCAISIDRYTAVAMPMLYNTRYSSRRRVAVMIAVVWFLSFAISCPLLFGLNNTANREGTTCSFADPAFVVYSSVASFYVPFIVTLLVYAQICLVLRKRGRRTAPPRRHGLHAQGGAEAGEGHRHRKNKCTQPEDVKLCTLMLRPATAGPQRKKVTLVKEAVVHPLEVEPGQFLPQTEQRLAGSFCSSQTSPDLPSHAGRARISLAISVGPAPVLPSTVTRSALMPRLPTLEDGMRGREGWRERSGGREKWGITKERVRGRGGCHSRRNGRRHRCSLLCSVSGGKCRLMDEVFVFSRVFIICWLPFFLTHVLKAHCRSCCISPSLYSAVTWLGYLNSAVNPVIYTTFNIEFRKAFIKILHC